MESGHLMPLSRIWISWLHLSIGNEYKLLALQPQACRARHRWPLRVFKSPGTAFFCLTNGIECGNPVTMVAVYMNYFAWKATQMSRRMVGALRVGQILSHRKWPCADFSSGSRRTGEISIGSGGFVPKKCVTHNGGFRLFQKKPRRISLIGAGNGWFLSK
jgi:hypothetical protein